MDEEWFSGLADELAAAIVDARACADACEELLEAGRELLGAEQRRQLLVAVVAPAAISRILIDLIDRPPALLLAAARICREASLDGAESLKGFAPPVDSAAAVAALRRAAESCGRLLAAAGAD